MSYQTWQATLVSSGAAGTTLAANANNTFLSMLPTSALYTFPANFFQAGQTALIITASGIIATSGTTVVPYWSIYINGSNPADFITFTPTASLSGYWQLKRTYYFQKSLLASSSGGLQDITICNSAGTVYQQNLQTGGVGNLNWLPNSAMTFDLQFSWYSGYAAGDSITLQDYSIEVIN